MLETDCLKLIARPVREDLFTAIALLGKSNCSAKAPFYREIAIMAYKIMEDLK